MLRVQSAVTAWMWLWVVDQTRPERESPCNEYPKGLIAIYLPMPAAADPTLHPSWLSQSFYLFLTSVALFESYSYVAASVLSLSPFLLGTSTSDSYFSTAMRMIDAFLDILVLSIDLYVCTYVCSSFHFISFYFQNFRHHLQSFNFHPLQATANRVSIK